MSGTRKLFRDNERYVKLVFFTCASISIFAVLLIILFVFRESLPAVKDAGMKNLFSAKWNPSVTDPKSGQYGIMGALYGTLITTVIGLIIGTPLAVGTAVFIDQIATPRIASIIRRSVEILAGVPSVVIGWFGLILLVPFLARVTNTTGYGYMAASLVLAVMVIPTITSLSAEALRSLPVELKEASLAMGATRWQTIHRTLLPAARRGILVAVILGMGRAMGETMAVQMVVGNGRGFSWGLLTPASTLTARMVTDMGEAPPGIFRSALFFQGLVLLGMAMVLIVAIRLVTRERKAGG